MTTAAVGARKGHRDRAATQGKTGNYRLVTSAFLLFALLAAGGASRADEPLQVVPRLAALFALVATLWPLQAPPSAIDRRLAWLAAGSYGLVMLQLVPLPPGLWAALPGHQVFARIAAEAGSSHWRPLSMTPDLTKNALFALLPASAAGMAYLYLDSTGRARLWGLVALGAVASAILGMVQIASGGDGLRLYWETTPGAPVGLFANRNHQAVFLASAMPIVGALIGKRLGRSQRLGPLLLALGAMMVLLLGIALTGSRSGLVMGLVGLAGGLACLRNQGQLSSAKTTRQRFALGGAIAAASVLILVFALRSGVVERLSQTDFASETRAQILWPLVRTAAAYMPLGSGFGSFSAVYRQFEPDALLSTIYLNEAHNEPVQLAIEGGMPALLLLGLFMWWWVGALVRLRRANSRAVQAAAAFLTLIMLSESLVDYPLRTPLLSALFAMACAELARTRGPATERQ